MRVCVVYVVKEVASFLGQLMGMTRHVKPCALELQTQFSEYTER